MSISCSSSCKNPIGASTGRAVLKTNLYLTVCCRMVIILRKIYFCSDTLKLDAKENKKCVASQVCRNEVLEACKL